MIKRRHGDVNVGVLHVGFKNLNADDMKRILCKLTSSWECRQRTCQRLDGVNKILTKLPPPVPLLTLNFVGNSTIGDAGMAHLHLIPDTVDDLDLADCGLTPKGIQTLCEYLKANTTIKRLVLWGNFIGDEGAKYVSEMLCFNTTLRSLCIADTQIGQKGFAHLSNGLAHNKTLQELFLANSQKLSNEDVKSLCPGLTLNKSLETLDLRGSNCFDEEGIGYLEECLRYNFHLKHIGIFRSFGFKCCIHTGPGSTCHRAIFWLCLNQMNRKVLTNETSTSLDCLVEAIVKCSKLDDISYAYYFLRNKPELCSVN